MKIPYKTKILITGAPRSGSYFTTRILFNLGLDIKHEKIDTNGTVSSVHLLNPSGFTKVAHQIRNPLKSISSLHKIDWLAQELWLESKNDENFSGHFKVNQASKKYSDVRLRENAWSYFLNKIKDSNLTRKCMKAYILWNAMAAEKSEFTYKLEDILSSKGHFDSWLESLGLIPEEHDYDITLKFVSGSNISNKVLGTTDGSKTQIGGVRVAPDLSWEILESLDSELSNEVKNLTSSFYN
tara:strand:- start:1228 stop:1947 length:720 start_codon:yes stop_codon:yes gene_type:complete